METALQNSGGAIKTSILQLIPSIVDINTIIGCLKFYMNGPETTKEGINVLFAAMIRNAPRQDVFSSYVVDCYEWDDHDTNHLPMRGDCEICTHQQLHAFCIIARKGLGSRTNPNYRQVIATMTDVDGDDYEDVAKTAQDIDALFDGPFSLAEECCFTIRASIQNPTYERILQLGLPDTICDQLAFLDVGKEIRDIMRAPRQTRINWNETMTLILTNINTPDRVNAELRCSGRAEDSRS